MTNWALLRDLVEWARRTDEHRYTHTCNCICDRAEFALSKLGLENAELVRQLGMKDRQ